MTPSLKWPPSDGSEWGAQRGKSEIRRTIGHSLRSRQIALPANNIDDVFRTLAAVEFQGSASGTVCWRRNQPCVGCSVDVAQESENPLGVDHLTSRVLCTV